MQPLTPALTHGPVTPTLLRFALPVLGGYVLQSASHSLHAFWIGRHLGEVALAAAVHANNLLFVLMGLVFGISQAAGILVAQSVGAADLPQARRVTGNSAGIFLGCALVIAAAAWPLAPLLLDWMGTPPAIAQRAQDYLRLLLLALPSQMLFIFATAILRGAGEARHPFGFLLAGVVVDAVLGPLLILGLGPLPALGMPGAALAALIAHAVSLAGLLGWMRRQRHPLWIARSQRHLLRPRWRLTRPLLTQGLPMGLHMLVVSLTLLALLALVNRQGVLAASAYSAAMQLWTYLQMPALAVGAACTSMAAQCVGAGRWQRITRIAHAGVWCNVLLTGGLAVLALSFDRQALSLFLPPSSDALAPARHINHIALGSFVLLGVSVVLSGVVRSTGAVLAPLLILVIALWGIRLPIAYGLHAGWGGDALWWSFPASAACAALMSLAYYHRGDWRHFRA